MKTTTENALHTIELIDREIEYHLSVIIDLRRRRNSLTPAFRIPSEILGEIFLLAVSEPADFISRADGLQRLLTICKHWQQVMLCHRKLWSHWSPMQPNWLPIFASRSGTTPLSIEMGDVGASFLQSWATVMEDRTVRDRVRDISITSGERSIAGLLKPFCCPEEGMCPYSIRSLRVCNETYFGSHVDFPRQFFSIPLPHLRVLHLSRCFVNWGSGILDSPNITHVQLKSMEITDDDGELLLAFLRNHPMLQELDIVRVPLINAQFPTPIEMQRLKVVKLLGPIEACARFMTQVAQPHDSKLQLCMLEAETEEFTSKILPLLRSRYGSQIGHPTNSGVSDLSIDHSKDFMLLIFSRTLPTDVWIHSSTPGTTTIALGRVMSPIMMMITLSASLSLANLQRIFFKSVKGSQEQWHDMFKAMVNLEILEIQVEYDSFLGIFAALQTSMDQDYYIPAVENSESPPECSTLLPQLEYLAISCIVTTDFGDLEELLFILTRFLETRERIGRRLEALYMRDFNGDSDQGAEGLSLWTTVYWETSL